MENLNEQDQIKDPDQLDMFAGIILTIEQQKQVDSHIDSVNKSTNYQKYKIQQIEQLLIEAGFKIGVDFENTFKSSLEIRTVSIGWGNNKFETEITAEFFSGDINLFGLCFNKYDKKIEKRKFGIDISNGKLQTSTTIQDQYRYVKPKTLLKKLEEHNEKSKQQFEEHKKKNSLKQSVIEKYTKLHPNAVITTKDDWSKYNGTFELIEVKFDSGSYIQFKLDTYKNVEFIYKKHDAEFEKMNAEELLERFSKQTKKEGSN